MKTGSAFGLAAAAVFTSVACQQILGIEPGQAPAATDGGGGSTSTGGGAGGAGGAGGDANACGDAATGQLLGALEASDNLGDQHVNAIARLSSGIVVGGTYLGDATFGDITFEVTAGSEAYILRLDEAHNPVAGLSFTGDGDASVVAMAARDGRVLAVVQYNGQLDVGSVPLDAAGSTDSVLVELDEDLSVQSVLPFDAVDPSDDVLLTAIALAPDGAVWVAGHFTGGVVYDANAPALTAVASRDVMVARIAGSPPGFVNIAASSGVGENRVTDLVVAGDGAIVMGTFDNRIQFSNPLDSVGDTDIWIASFRPQGAAGGGMTIDWSQQLGTAEPEVAGGLAAYPGGDVLVTFAHGPNLDLGVAPVPAVAGLAAVRLTPTAPAPTWLYHQPVVAEPRAAAVDADGHAVIVGLLLQGDDLGGGPLVDGPFATGFILSLTGEGQHHFSALVAADDDASPLRDVTAACTLHIAGTVGGQGPVLNPSEGDSSDLPDGFGQDALVFELDR